MFGPAHPHFDLKTPMAEQVNHFPDLRPPFALMRDLGTVCVQIARTPQAAKTCFRWALEQAWTTLRIHVDQGKDPFGDHAAFGGRWKSGGPVGVVACHAALLYRASRTRGGTRRADGGAEFHHGLIPHAWGNVPLMGTVHPCLGQGRDITCRRLKRRRLARHNPTDVPVNHGRRHLVCDGGNGSSGVRTDAGQPLKIRDRVIGG